MTTLKNTLHDSNNGLDYTMVNGYYLPNLTVAAPTEQHPTCLLYTSPSPRD